MTTVAEPALRPGRRAVPREVVACLMSYEDRYLLLRRSPHVGSDRGRWHCVTGFCEPGVDPLEQALREVHEETGVAPGSVRLVRRVAPLELQGDDGSWVVHAFHFSCASSRVTLNWEHDDARWIHDWATSGLPTVPWLDAVHRTLTDSPEVASCA